MARATDSCSLLWLPKSPIISRCWSPSAKPAAETYRGRTFSASATLEQNSVLRAPRRVIRPDEEDDRDMKGRLRGRKEVGGQSQSATISGDGWRLKARSAPCQRV